MRLLNYSLASLDAPEQPTVLAIGRERVTKPVTIRWHSHTRGQAVVVSTGLLTIYTRQGSWMVSNGHSVWIPPGQEHALRLCGNFSGWYVYVAPEMCVRLPERFGSAPTPSLLREGIARISHWQDSGDLIPGVIVGVMMQGFGWNRHDPHLHEPGGELHPIHRPRIFSGSGVVGDR